MTTEQKFQIAYSIWRFDRYSRKGNVTLRQLDDEFKSGLHDDDFKKFLDTELAEILKKQRSEAYAN